MENSNATNIFGCSLLLPYFLIWLFPTTALFPYLAVTVPYYCLISLFGCNSSLLLPYFLIWLFITTALFPYLAVPYYCLFPYLAGPSHTPQAADERTLRSKS